jgi:hypothetical protein
VCFQNAQKFCLGPVSVVDPVGKLAVPEEGVTASHLACFFAGVDNLITEGVVEDITLWFDVYPFLTVGRRDLVELRTVEGNICVFCVI